MQIIIECTTNQTNQTNQTLGPTQECNELRLRQLELFQAICLKARGIKPYDGKIERFEKSKMREFFEKNFPDHNGEQMCAEDLSIEINQGEKSFMPLDSLRNGEIDSINESNEITEIPSLSDYKKTKIQSPLGIYADIYNKSANKSKNKPIRSSRVINDMYCKLLIEMIINLKNFQYLRFFYCHEYNLPLLIKYNDKSKKISVFLSIDHISHNVSESVFLIYLLLDKFKFFKGMNIYISEVIDTLWGELKSTQIPKIIKELQRILGVEYELLTIYIDEFTDNGKMMEILVKVEKDGEDNHALKLLNEFEMPVKILGENNQEIIEKDNDQEIIEQDNDEESAEQIGSISQEIDEEDNLEQIGSISQEIDEEDSSEQIGSISQESDDEDSDDDGDEDIYEDSDDDIDEDSDEEIEDEDSNE